MSVLARFWLGPGFWLGSRFGPRILDLAKISTFGEKSTFWPDPGFLDPNLDLAKSVPDPYMSTLRVRMCMQVSETPHDTMYAMHVRYMLATCTHTNRVKGKLLHVYILEKYAKFVHE